MAKLFIFNFLMIAVVTLLLWVVKRTVKTERQKNLLLIGAAVFTVLLHYSMLFYHCFKGSALEYLKETPNLILPIYPCNLVMWSAVVFAFLKNKKSKLGEFLSDYIFWFGLISALVGMFANVDFIMNPTFSDFNITKSILAHVTLLFNILLLPIFGFVKIDMFRNMKNILLSYAVQNHVVLLHLALGSSQYNHISVSPEQGAHTNTARHRGVDSAIPELGLNCGTNKIIHLTVHRRKQTLRTPRHCYARAPR